MPVRAITGSTPFYRDLSIGDSGRDVDQLKSALKRMGYLDSRSRSGYDWYTKLAVIQWQKKLHIPSTGSVRRGVLVAVPKLPATLTIDHKVAQKGALLSGGESIVLGTAGQPDFALVLSADRAKNVPAGAAATVHDDDLQWRAVITQTHNKPDGSVSMDLAAPGGGIVCGKQCNKLPPAETTYLPSDIEVIPPTSGPAVPVAAITTRPDGSTVVTVVNEAGKTTEEKVTVKASRDGIAIVDGVQVGQNIRVLSRASGEPPSTWESTAASPSATSTGG